MNFRVLQEKGVGKWWLQTVPPSSSLSTAFLFELWVTGSHPVFWKADVRRQNSSVLIREPAWPRPPVFCVSVFTPAFTFLLVGRVVWLIHTSGWFYKLTHLALDWGIYKHSSQVYELSSPILKCMAKPCCCLGEASVKLKPSREQIQHGDKAAAVSVLGWAKNFGTFFAVDGELLCSSTEKCANLIYN